MSTEPVPSPPTGVLRAFVRGVLRLGVVLAVHAVSIPVGLLIGVAVTATSGVGSAAMGALVGAVLPVLSLVAGVIAWSIPDTFRIVYRGDDPELEMLDVRPADGVALVVVTVGLSVLGASFLTASPTWLPEVAFGAWALVACGVLLRAGVARIVELWLMVLTAFGE